MSQPGAVVDVVVADDGALEFLAKIILFVKDFATAKHPDTFSTVFTGNLFQALGSKLNGLIPGDQLQLIRFADIRLLQTFFMIDKLVHRKAFDTEVFGI